MTDSLDGGEDELEDARAGLYAMVKAIKKSPYTDEQIEEDIDGILFHIEPLIAQNIQQAVEKALDLLYWLYKEKNGQSVDIKFVEAWNQLKEENRKSQENNKLPKSNDTDTIIRGL
jgi:hypothetical protein